MKVKTHMLYQKNTVIFSKDSCKNYECFLQVIININLTKIFKLIYTYIIYIDQV